MPLIYSSCYWKEISKKLLYFKIKIQSTSFITIDLDIVLIFNNLFKINHYINL